MGVDQDSIPKDSLWTTAPELARWANVCPMTARAWIEHYRLARKVGVRWPADVEKAREFLVGASAAAVNGESPDLA
jgi:hypothetical protein